MSTIEKPNWQSLVNALAPRLDRLQEGTVALPQSEKAAKPVERAPWLDLDYLAAVLQQQMRSDPLLQQVRVVRESRRLVIAVPGDLLFASGSTELGAAGEKSVFVLSGVLRRLRTIGRASCRERVCPYV